MRTLVRLSCAFAAALLFSLSLAGQQARAQNCAPPPPGLVSWYPANSNANDVQSGNNGILEGSLTFATGEVAQAFSFDGTTANVKIPAAAGLDVGISNGLTIDLWLNPANLNERSLVEWNSNQPGTGIAGIIGVHLSVSVTSQGAAPGNLYANLIDTSGNSHIIQSNGVLINTNQWQHAALTYDKTTGSAAIYLNGTVIAGPTNIGSFTPQTSYP